MIKSLRDILVISDMDNTLLTAKTGIPLCNLETIKLFTRLGGRFTVATGRTIESVRHYLTDLPLSAPAIVCGGAILYDFQSKRKMQNKTLPKAIAAKALLDVKLKFPNIGIEIMGDTGKIYVVQANSFTYNHTLYEKLEYVITDISEVCCEWNKILFACDNKMLKDVQAYVASKEYEGIYFVATNDIYFEVMSCGVSKGVALIDLCNSIGVAKENTFAIGDYFNDLELLNAAGHSVAVANAPMEVQIAADELTASCLEGGVGQFLYKLIKKYS